MQKIVVDGYNVIHADERLKRTFRKDMKSARRGLVKMLAAYLEKKNLQVTLVFDGRGGMTDVEVEIPGKLQILYSSAGQSADEVIVEILEKSTNPRQYIVVTSDMADIGRTARSMGSDVVSSMDFLSRIRRKDTPEREAAGDEIKDPSVDDIDYWLKKFGNGGENS